MEPDPTRSDPSPLPPGKTAAFMLPVLERLVYKPKTAQVTRVLVLVPTRELGIQVHSVARQLAQFTSVTTCLAVGTTPPMPPSPSCPRHPPTLTPLRCRPLQVGWTSSPRRRR